jgi:hypothetical protein
MPGRNGHPGRFDAGYRACEFAETLSGNLCELSGTARFSGALLCEKHAGQLEARERLDLLRGIVSFLDLCLRNVLIRKNTNLTRLLNAERTRAESQLEPAHEALRRTIA